MTPEIELQEKIALWRQKALDNTLTLDECKEAIIHLRQGRAAASAAAAKAGKGAKKPAVNTDALLDELKGL